LSETVIKVENLSKQYRLGVIGTGTLSHDLNRWWHRVRGKEDPYLQIGERNERDKKGESDLVWALRDINFEVKQGEVLGIIGKNGAGKSTLLKILSKVTGPSTGRIMAKGRIASLLEVGTGFHPELTGRENIYLNGTILGMSKAEVRKKLDEIVDFAGVERYLDTPVKRYSSGMKVRLGFAVAAHLEPDILIVDEVLAVGDAEFQKKAIGKMQEVSREGGRTVLFVSHNMGSVKTLCNSAMVIDNGKVIFSGSSEDAINEYLKFSSYAGDMELGERKDRIGNGKLKFTGITLRNLKGEAITEAISGEGLKLEIRYRSDGSLNAKDVKIGLIFRNNLGQNIMSFPSEEMKPAFHQFKREGAIYLNIPRLFLRGERYSIRLLAFEGDTDMSNALDIVDNAMWLNVLPGDIWNAGKLNRPGYSSIVPAEYLSI